MSIIRPASLGTDRLIASHHLEGRRVGLVCNSASVNAVFHHTADRLASAAGVSLISLFGPQHGLRSEAQDNMVETPHTRHPHLQVPIYSLYSNTREPTREMLDGIDVLVVDLPDVGTRVYTFAYTMANCLKAAKRYGVPVIICDRPNPIGGKAIEGPVLQPGYESFVGQFPIPLRHGMTIGELARLFNEHFGIGADLEIMALDGWKRSMYHDDIGFPWIMPSPNLPTLDSAVVYPGAVLLEGTNLSEGRGTTRPFELVGAPWVDEDGTAKTLNALDLPGVFFRPVRFEPTFHKHAHKSCGGCQIHVTDRKSFKPVLTIVAVLQTFKRSAPQRFAWKEPPYEYEQSKLPIDILFGSNRLREQIDLDLQATEIVADWEEETKAFDQIRAGYLMY